MVNKKILVWISVLVVIILSAGIYGYNYYNSHKDIETMVAAIQIDFEEIISEHDGIIKELNFKTSDKIKEGDIIGTISKSDDNSDCPDKSQMTKEQKQAAAKYENAAIMYKDGIITKEEYDKSLAEYRYSSKNIQSQNCKEKEEIYKIYSPKSGKLFLSDSVAEGSKISENQTIGKVADIKNLTVKAYFSPKYKKIIKDGDNAEIKIVKYPEKTFSGEVVTKDKIDIFGQSVILKINESVDNLNLENEDAVIVKIIKH